MPNRPPTEDREAVVAELEELLVRGGASVIATDLDGVITHWSGGSQRLYGWSGDEAIGLHVAELLLAPDVAEEVLETVERTGGWEGELHLQCKDGASVPAYVHDALIKDDAGRPVGILSLSMTLA